VIALRSLIFNIYFFGVTILALFVSLPLFVLPRVCVNRLARGWAWLVCLGLRVICGVTIELRGDVALLREPVLIVSKHQSAWDTLYFYLVCPDPTYVMKKELLRVPIYGWLAIKQKMIRVDRKGGAKALKRMLDGAMEAVADRRQIIIFPQGTRVKPGASTADYPYQPGTAGLYAKLGIPCVLVALNSGQIWGRRSFYKHPGTIYVDVLGVIPPGVPRAAFMREIETRIETASTRLEAESAP
jgi:1-acyl-sn-glycerol-3-phosphate acyltransferase